MAATDLRLIFCTGTDFGAELPTIWSVAILPFMKRGKNLQGAQEAYIVSTVYVRGRKLRLHLHFDEDGGFWVNSPDLKGLVTQGNSTDEAIANGVDAVVALIEARAKASARSLRR